MAINMSKTVKNLLLIFTLICAIVLVVFVIELIVVNKDNGAAEKAAAPPRNASAETSESPSSPPPSPAGAGAPSVTNTNTGTQAKQPDKQAGKRYELLYPGGETLVLYADEELFELYEMDSGDIFIYLGGGNASLEICPAYAPNGAEACAETFLDGYLEGNESFVSGMSNIKRSELSGVFVSGVNGDETFEAWIQDMADSSDDMGMAFIIRYKNNDQKNALYAVLDTLELTPV